jgi:putative iron-dependent peroxidase
MPNTSHVSRMRDEQYQRIPIVRQSMPYHSSHNKNGLLFIAYSSNVAKFDKMLDRMTGNTGDKLNDSIMKYSKCVTGNYWYFPSLDGKN